MQRRRRSYVVRFTNLDLLENVVAESPRWRRHVPAALTLLALTALVIGIARPEVAVAVPREEATVILAMDSSGSMTATDVAPDRMTAAREAASSFVEGLPDGFRVGVVSFSNEADVVVPPTEDRDEASRALQALQADNGTALGDAIARSVDLGLTSLDEQPPPQRRGHAGRRPRPLRRCEHDRRLRAARGRPEGGRRERAGLHRRARHRRRHDPGPRRLRRHAHDPRPARPETLAEVAEMTGGTFFEAADEDALQSVYDEIGSQVGVEHEQRELTVLFTAAGALLLLLGGALSTLWFARIP